MNVNKQALLDWLDGLCDIARVNFDLEKRSLLERIMCEIQSGRFDSDVQMTQSDVYKAANEILTLRGEVDRLQAALEALPEKILKNKRNGSTNSGGGWMNMCGEWSKTN